MDARSEGKGPPRRGHGLVRWPRLVPAALLCALPAPAFVTLDTSDSTSIPAPAKVAPPPAAPGPVPAEALPRRYGAALFLGAGGMEFYACLGILEALEDYGLAPDAVVGESRGALLAAGWALGYPAKSLERIFTARPLDYFLRPLAAEPRERFRPLPAQEAPPVDLSLRNASRDYEDFLPGAAPAGRGGEWPHLAWLIATLTHDGPRGPCDRIEAAPRPLFLQLADTRLRRLEVVGEGRLQDLLKASALPEDWVHARPSLAPYAPGDLAAGHRPARGPWPFACGVLVWPDFRRAAPPGNSGDTSGWRDSLWRDWAADASAEGDSALERRGVLRLEVDPGPDFPRGSRDPEAWRRLGYRAALESMDLLRTTLATAPPAAPPRPAAGLGGDRVAINPLASGGRQYLLDVLRKVEAGPDSLGYAQVQALVNSGFYSGLDVEWVPEGEDAAALVFDARERSRIDLRAGGNLAWGHGPEAYGALAWAEPFYIPFEATVSGEAGGRRTGLAGEAAIHPIYPVDLRLGVARLHQALRFPLPGPGWGRQGAIPLRLDEDLSRLFLSARPSRGSYLGAAILRHDLARPADASDSSQASLADLGLASLPEEYLSVDFLAEALVADRDLDGPSRDRDYLYLAYRNRNPDNLFGPRRLATSSGELLAQAVGGPLRLRFQAYASDQDAGQDTDFAPYLAGKVAAFDYGEDAFLASLRGVAFVHGRAELFHRLRRPDGLELAMAGGSFRPLAAWIGPDVRRGAWQGYWQVRGEYPTPVGPLRAGMESLAWRPPVFFLQLGMNVDLGNAPP